MFYVQKYFKDRCKSFLKPISGRGGPTCSQSYPQALCVQNGASNLPVYLPDFLPAFLPICPTVFGRRSRVFRHQTAKSDLPFDWRLRQRRARVPGSRAGATIACVVQRPLTLCLPFAHFRRSAPMQRCRPLSRTLPFPSPLHRPASLPSQARASFAPDHKARHV